MADEYGLQPHSMKARRRWAADWDYLHRLGPEERAWLERFGREYYGGDSKALEAPDALHRTRELKRACYQLDNFARIDAVSMGRVAVVADLSMSGDECRTSEAVRRAVARREVQEWQRSRK